jgi:hypothetical protein
LIVGLKEGILHSNSVKPALIILIALCAIEQISFAEQVIRGDESQLPQIDYSKQFNMKGFGTSTYSGAERSFATKNFETKTLQLPSYYGNLKPLPLTEWNSPKRDVYSKTVTLQEYQLKKAVDRWSNQLTLREDDADRTDPAVKDGSVPTRNIDTKEEDVPKNVTGQSLKDLINKGAKPEPVKTGRGFTADELKGPTESKEDSKEQSKTESQPK